MHDQKNIKLIFLIAYVLNYEEVVGKWNKDFHIIILDTGWR